MGETWQHEGCPLHEEPFSILKRIVMGETYATIYNCDDDRAFQYPQADRDG